MRGRGHFCKFWIGQTISCFGSAFTRFALPLLVFYLTHSSFDLGLTTAVTFLPPVLFGLMIGVWSDHLNRKWVMILADIMRALVIVLLSLLALLHLLSIWWIYVIAFVSSFLAMCFETCQFSALSSIVPPGELLKANARISASFTTATILGMLLAGLVILWLPLPMLFVLDAISFLLSACSLALIPINFNGSSDEQTEVAPLHFRHELQKGLSSVWKHPLLRCLVFLLTLLNFAGSTINAQIVLFAKQSLHASDAEVSLFFSMGSVGVVLFSVAAEHVKKRWSYSRLTLGSFFFLGVFTSLLAVTRWYWAALSLWMLIQGCEALFNITLLSLVMPIIPQELMGRVTSVIRVLAWAAIPVGTLFWGWIIAFAGHVTFVYGVIGGLLSMTTLLFLRTPVGHAERYLPDTMP